MSCGRARTASVLTDTSPRRCDLRRCTSELPLVTYVARANASSCKRQARTPAGPGRRTCRGGSTCGQRFPAAACYEDDLVPSAERAVPTPRGQLVSGARLSAAGPRARAKVPRSGGSPAPEPPSVYRSPQPCARLDALETAGPGPHADLCESLGEQLEQLTRGLDSLGCSHVASARHRHRPAATPQRGGGVWKLPGVPGT